MGIPRLSFIVNRWSKDTAPNKWRRLTHHHCASATVPRPCKGRIYCTPGCALVHKQWAAGPSLYPPFSRAGDQPQGWWWVSSLRGCVSMCISNGPQARAPIRPFQGRKQGASASADSEIAYAVAGDQPQGWWWVSSLRGCVSMCISNGPQARAPIRPFQGRKQGASASADSEIAYAVAGDQPQGWWWVSSLRGCVSIHRHLPRADGLHGLRTRDQ